MHRSIYLSIYGSTALCWTLAAFQFIFYTVGRTPWMGDLLVARPLPAHTGQHKHRINAHRYPWLKWDSNLRPQCLSGRRQTARPLWSAMHRSTGFNFKIKGKRTLRISSGSWEHNIKMCLIEIDFRLHLMFSQRGIVRLLSFLVDNY
jgi:hypothetical protein